MKLKDFSSSTIPGKSSKFSKCMINVCVLLELSTEHLVKIAEKINARDARQLALELGFCNSEYEHIRSFGHEKRVILYILLTWFDRSDSIRDKHIYLDQALIATGYRTLAITATGNGIIKNNRS